VGAFTKGQEVRPEANVVALYASNVPSMFFVCMANMNKLRNEQG
jgi:hypothetical protein